VLPNVTLDDPIEASRAALLPCGDPRLGEIASRHATLGKFVSAFRDEFGTRICPTIGLARDDAPRSVSNATVVGAFRDAVCVSAIAAGRGLTLKCDRPCGILHSDAFDFYPWFPSSHPDFETYVFAYTPAARRSVEAGELKQPQSSPALGNRALSAIHIDRPLLNELLARWEHCFAAGNNGVKDRRL
jgi:hypothetical protein